MFLRFLCLIWSGKNGSEGVKVYFCTYKFIYTDGVNLRAVRRLLWRNGASCVAINVLDHSGASCPEKTLFISVKLDLGLRPGCCDYWLRRKTKIWYAGLIRPRWPRHKININPNIVEQVLPDTRYCTRNGWIALCPPLRLLRAVGVEASQSTSATFHATIAPYVQLFVMVWHNKKLLASQISLFT